MRSERGTDGAKSRRRDRALERWQRRSRRAGELMEILYLLIPLSVVMAFAIGAAFLWSVRSGQFDDLEGPSHRILQDDDNAPQPGNAASAVSSLTDPRKNMHG